MLTPPLYNFVVYYLSNKKDAQFGQPDLTHSMSLSDCCRIKCHSQRAQDKVQMTPAYQGKQRKALEYSIISSFSATFFNLCF